jgi:hypothetical protein
MENQLVNRVDLTVTNIVKGFEDAKSTLRVACGVKISDAGKPSLIFATVSIDGKFLTVPELIEQIAKLPKTSVKLPTTGKGSKVEVKVQGSMPGARFACLAAYQAGVAKPSVCSDEQYANHLQACGIALISPNAANEGNEGNAANESEVSAIAPPTAANVPNVGNREETIANATQTNPRKRQNA